MANDSHQDPTNADEADIDLPTDGLVTENSGAFRVSRLVIGGKVVAETVGDMGGQFAVVRNGREITAGTRWAYINAHARCGRMYDHDIFSNEPRKGGKPSMQEMMAPPTLENGIKAIVAGWDAKMAGPVNLLKAGASGLTDNIGEPAMFRVYSTHWSKYILPFRSSITPGNITFMKTVVKAEGNHERLISTDQHQVLRDCFQQLKRGKPVVPLAKNKNVQGGGSTRILFRGKKVSQGFVLRVPFIHHIRYPDDLIQMLNTFRSQFPRELISLNQALIATQVWADLGNQNNSKDSEAWATTPEDRAELIQVPLSHHIIYFPHMVRWTEWQQLVEHPHPYRFIRAAYRYDTQKKATSVMAIPEHFFDEKEVKRLLQKVVTVPGAKTKIGDRLDVYPFTFPGTKIMGVDGFKIDPRAKIDCGLGSVYQWGLPNYEKEDYSTTIQVMAPKVILQLLAFNPTNIVDHKSPDTKQFKSFQIIGSAASSQTAPKLTDGPFWKRMVEENVVQPSVQCPDGGIPDSGGDITETSESDDDGSTRSDSVDIDIPTGKRPTSHQTNKAIDDMGGSATKDGAVPLPLPTTNENQDGDSFSFGLGAFLQPSHKRVSPREEASRGSLTKKIRASGPDSATIASMEKSNIRNQQNQIGDISGSTSPLPTTALETTTHTALGSGFRSPAGSPVTQIPIDDLYKNLDALLQSGKFRMDIGDCLRMNPQIGELDAAKVAPDGRICFPSVWPDKLQPLLELMKSLPAYIHFSVGHFREHIIYICEGGSDLYWLNKQEMRLHLKARLADAIRAVEHMNQLENLAGVTQVEDGVNDSETIANLLCHNAGYSTTGHPDWVSCLDAQPEQDEKLYRFKINMRGFLLEWNILINHWNRTQVMQDTGANMTKDAAQELLKNLLELLHPGVEMVAKIVDLIEKF